ncbi:MAG: type II secretion system protein GspG, partial [Planctomycetota bacterium]
MNRIDKPSPIRGCCAGFSLIEIIVAVSIMTILVGMALPVLSTSVTRAKKKETREELNALKTSIEGYFQDVWAFPGSLNELVENISAVDGWVGPYITLPLSAASNDAPSISKDAWNQDYVITFSGNSSMEVSSLGPDASCGTS